MELVEDVKELLIETAISLKGSPRRLFLARTVRALGEGGQRLAEQKLGWNRGTIRKGQHELEQGIVCLDTYSSRGHKRSEEHLPNLLNDITALVDGQSQVDPQFRTNRLYTRLTATAVRRQLITPSHIKNSGDFRTSILLLADSNATSPPRSLEEYLRALWSLIQQAQNQPVTYTL